MNSAARLRLKAKKVMIYPIEAIISFLKIEETVPGMVPGAVSFCSFFL